MANYIIGFKKDEVIAVSAILLIIFVATFLNLVSSERKARDGQRKDDIRSIHDALSEYQRDFSSFPQSSEEGKIVACKPEGVSGDDLVENRLAPGPCDWNTDALRDIYDESYPAYIDHIPSDPHHAQGASYYYLSNGRYFQIYAALEGEREPEYDPEIVKRNLPCGKRICNFGRSFRKTPLDKSIEEYENELRQKELNRLKNVQQ